MPKLEGHSDDGRCNDTPPLPTPTPPVPRAIPSAKSRSACLRSEATETEPPLGKVSGGSRSVPQRKAAILVNPPLPINSQLGPYFPAIRLVTIAVITSFSFGLLSAIISVMATKALS